VIELERQVLGHDVPPVVFGAVPVQAAPALQQHHHELVTGMRQRHGLYV
jgi:hypothetical protein